MKLLILGGTRFLGRALVDQALARGHQVTLFNRGRTNPALFSNVEHLRGDRGGDLEALEGRAWDAAIDTSGYVPRDVRASAGLLRESAGQYLFVSSISVYADFSSGPDEDSPAAQLGEDSADELREDYANYGALKALCEAAVARFFGGRALVVRPGLIVGAHDPTGRFTYWPHRIARGGDVLVPGPPERKVQFIDVRDLAGWMIAGCERKLSGTYNATNTGVEWRELVQACQSVAGSDARLVWVSDQFLAEHDVGEWMELPLWLHAPEWLGHHETNVSRALAAGLSYRPLEETVRATLEEAETTDDAGLTAEREAELIDLWKARV